jgi:hypothetical protein
MNRWIANRAYIGFSLNFLLDCAAAHQNPAHSVSDPAKITVSTAP